MKVYSKEILMLTYCLFSSVVLLIFSCNDSKPFNSKVTESNFSLAYKRSGGDSTSTYREVMDFDDLKKSGVTYSMNLNTPVIFKSITFKTNLCKKTALSMP